MEALLPIKGVCSFTTGETFGLGACKKKVKIAAQIS
jgi:hypothetical protein